MKPKAAFLTLGCKVNQNETEALSALFQKKGYEIVDPHCQADIYIINTCTVTHLADRKSRQMIRKAINTNPSAKIVVMGCYSQTSPEEVQKIPGVDLIVGTGDRGRILELLREIDAEKGPLNVVKDIAAKKAFEDIRLDKNIGRARAYLKVQEGCEQFCSYCIIPYARGPVRSRPPDNALREAKRLIAAGFQEVVLTGIHLGAYGQDLGKNISLADLLAELLALSPRVRWRLSSLEPTEVTTALIDLLKNNRNFCPHLHLPLQSGHDEILRAMKRPYTTADYEEVVSRVRSAVPDISITTDIMVGFPGEKEKHFQAYLEFVERMAFGGLHVFQYSPRKGTPAAEFPDQVSPQVKEERSHRLIELGERLKQSYSAKFCGKTLNVLVEKQVTGDIWEGHSENYLKIRFPFSLARKGEIAPVKLLRVEDGYCWGSLEAENSSL